MPKLPVVSARNCIDALEKLGFYIARQKGSHITLRCDEPSGRVTVPSHKELKPGMLKRILKDAGLNTQEFIDALKK
jgi:predicted RNA binding protein YcfA (HicA-like mRNA interferase family)